MKTIVYSIGLLLLLESGALFAQEQTLWDRRDQRYWESTVVIPEVRFTVSEVESMARKFLGEAAEGRIVVRLSIFTNAEDAAMNAGPSHDSYMQWRVDYDRIAQRPLRMAQATAIRGNAVLRIRLADGTVLRRVLYGADPLHIESDGVDFEILALWFRLGTRFDRCQIEGALSPVAAYVMTDAPLTAHASDRVTARLSELLETKILFVGFRNDHWFITGGFPVIYPFADPSEPPSEAEYYRSTVYSCMIWCEYQPPCEQTGELPPPPARAGRSEPTTTKPD